MKVTDWRLADAGAMAPLYAEEAGRWRRKLRWDTSDLWSRIETARSAGTLPGFVVMAPGGRIRGWSFHLRHGDTVQIGGLATASHEATADLIDAIWTSDEAASAQGALVFGHFEAPGLIQELAAKGMPVKRYRYLLRSLSPEASDRTPSGAAPRQWQAGDLSGVSDLLARAYGPDPARPFAPEGRPADWVEYLNQLLGTPGCGTFDPAVSLVASSNSDGLHGVALVTRLAPETAHLAQLAVHPEVQARGMGTALLAEVMTRTGAAGYRALTLLVSESNVGACRLYDQCGFTESAAFLSGSCQYSKGKTAPQS